MKEVDFNPEFITRMLPKIEWSALQKAAKEVSTVTRYQGTCYLVGSIFVYVSGDYVKKLTTVKLLSLNVMKKRHCLDILDRAKLLQ